MNRTGERTAGDRELVRSVSAAFVEDDARAQISPVVG